MAEFEAELDNALNYELLKEKDAKMHTEYGAVDASSVRVEGEFARLAARLRSITNDASGLKVRLSDISNRVFGHEPPSGEIRDGNVKPLNIEKMPHISMLDNLIMQLENEIHRAHSEINRLEKL